jgi:hypothetical protein
MFLREIRRRNEKVSDGFNPIEWIKYGRAIPNINQVFTIKGEFDMLPEVGVHTAKAAERQIYENEKGTLVFAANFVINENTSIIGRQCLTTSDGALNTKTIDRLKRVFGWDGLDPYWLVDTDLSGLEVEITVEEQAGNDGKSYKNVKWLNKPGDQGTKEIPQGDKGQILAKYGAKFRALAGGSAPQGRVAPSGAAKKPATPPPPPPKKAALPPPSRKAKKAATMQEAWELFCSKAEEAIRPEDVSSEWYDCIKKTVGKEQHDCDENDWGIIVEEMDEYFNRLKF